MAENIEKQPLEAAISITSTAIAELKRLLTEEKQVDLFLRLGVSSGGCSGMSYALAFDDKPLENDREFEFDGLKVRIDDQSLGYLKGTELNYTGGMIGGGFSFSNPNAKRSCGCGSSFTC